MHSPPFSHHGTGRNEAPVLTGLTGRVDCLQWRDRSSEATPSARLLSQLPSSEGHGVSQQLCISNGRHHSRHWGGGGGTDKTQSLPTREFAFSLGGDSQQVVKLLLTQLNKWLNGIFADKSSEENEQGS